MKKLFFIFTLATILISPLAQAQSTYFTGNGRALFSNDKQTNSIDTLGEQAASSGYTVYDLGINFENKGLIRAGAILRLRSEFGGFYSDGSSLEIRQVQIEGILGKYVKYEIGDMYMSQTPYTIWNFEESFNDYEAEIFTHHRDVVEYENFFIDNKWRTQGVNLFSRINFMKVLKSAGLQAYGARLINSDQTNTPDRLMFGGRLDIKQSNNFDAGINVVSISDIQGTIDSSDVDLDNIVTTLDYEVRLLEKKKFRIGFDGEAGFSYTHLREDTSSTNDTITDFFYDLGVSLKYYGKSRFTFKVNYKDVGPDFKSPTAQTRRIIEDPNQYEIQAFPTFNDAITPRAMTLMDRLSQENGLYNNTISTHLMPYLPQYNNIEPYGSATPNRNGIILNAAYADSAEIIQIQLTSKFLSEIYSEGLKQTKDLRSFTCFQGGFEFDAHTLFGWKKNLVLKSGMKYELTERSSDTLPVDLSSLSMDVGLDIEPFKNFHLLAGYKFLTAEGTEAPVLRNRLDYRTNSGTPVDINCTESLIGLGFRYDFANFAHFTTQYIAGNYTDKTSGTPLDIKTSQWYFMFNISF